MTIGACVLVAMLLGSCECSGLSGMSVLHSVSHSVSVVSVKFSLEARSGAEEAAVIASSAPAAERRTEAAEAGTTAAPRQEPLPTSESTTPMTSHVRQPQEEKSRQDLPLDGQIALENSASVEMEGSTGDDEERIATTAAASISESDLAFPVGEEEYVEFDRDEASALFAVATAANSTSPSSALSMTFEVEGKESPDGDKSGMAMTLGMTLGAAVFVVSGLIGMGLFVHFEKIANRPRMLDANDSSSESGVSGHDSGVAQISQADFYRWEPHRECIEDSLHLDDSFLFSLENVANPASNWKGVKSTSA